ncbi:hypothetical protein ACFVYJ_09345 [Pontibacter sp. JAM-7]|uniref:hypothetical protein n=1 Tax=Pontibacter sp. JAM-7 TaxID=3366581 RepID=UPI003AF59CF1
MDMDICSNYRFQSSLAGWLYKLLLLALMSLLTAPLFAQDNPYNLPSLYSDPGSTADTEPLDAMQKSLRGRKRLEQSLKSYTRTQLGRDSIIYLQKDGIKLETKYRQGDVRTELETHDDNEVTFTLKVSF